MLFISATNIVEAYDEARKLITKQVAEKRWDRVLLESAKSSVMFDIVNEEITLNDVMILSLLSYFQKVDYKHNRSDSSSLVLCTLN